MRPIVRSCYTRKLYNTIAIRSLRPWFCTMRDIHFLVFIHKFWHSCGWFILKLVFLWFEHIYQTLPYNFGSANFSWSTYQVFYCRIIHWFITSHTVLFGVPDTIYCSCSIYKTISLHQTFTYQLISYLIPSLSYFPIALCRYCRC